MFSYRRSLPLIRISLLLVAFVGLSVLVAFDSRSPENAGADPAFGNVRPSPASGVVIEGHVFSLPVQMTTCADNATPISGTATSGSATTLVNTGAAWTTNQWTGYDIQLTSGTSSPQWRVVASNTSNTITVSEAWGSVPDTGTATAGSTGSVADTGTDAEGPHTSTTLKDIGEVWTVNQWAGRAVELTGGTGAGQVRFIVSNTADTLTVSPAWTTAASGTLTGAPTTTVLADVSKNFTVNALTGMTLDMLTGAQAGQSRTIASNTATAITLSSALPGAPAFGDSYRVAQLPGATTDYEIEHATTVTDTGSGWFGTEFVNGIVEFPGLDPSQTRTIINNGTDTLTVWPAWTTIVAQNAAASGTANTLVDPGSFAPSAYANKTVQIISGAASGQSRRIQSNDSNTLTIEGTWTTTAGGTLTGVPTTTVLADVSKNFTVNALAGMTLDMLSGAQAGESRTIASNTATAITLSSALPGAPAFGDIYRVERVPDVTSLYVVRDGPAIGTAFQIKDISYPVAGTGYQLFKSACRPGGYNLSVGYNALASPTGIADSPFTTTTLKDAGQTWTVNQWAGKLVVLTAGTGSGQKRTILSNTPDTLTIGVPWTTMPDATTVYEILLASFDVAADSGISTAGNTTTTLNDTGKVTVLNSGVNATGPHTTTTLKDTAKAWTVNQWVGDAVDLTGGTGSPQTRIIVSNTADTLTISPAWVPVPDATTDYNIRLPGWKINQWAGSRVNIILGAGVGQSRLIVSNTATQLVVTPAWSIPQPTTSSLYIVGGTKDGGWLESTGRTTTCPLPATYGSGTTGLACVTLGTPPSGLPQGPTGTGSMVSVVFQAIGRGLSTFTNSGQILEVDGSTIPADVATASRRVILCPDSAPFASPDGRINIADIGATAQANGAKGPPLQAIPDPLYTPQKDPDENGVSNVADRGILAVVKDQRCIQP